MVKPQDDIRLALFLNFDYKGKLYNVDFEYFNIHQIPPDKEEGFILLSEKYAKQRIESYKKME